MELTSEQRENKRKDFVLEFKVTFALFGILGTVMLIMHGFVKDIWFLVSGIMLLWLSLVSWIGLMRNGLMEYEV